MTRFARAKGSKASNERRPEEATSWCELRKCMLSQKPKEEPKEQSAEEVGKTDNVQEHAEWASFGDDDFGGSVLSLKQHLSKKKKKDRKVEVVEKRKIKGLDSSSMVKCQSVNEELRKKINKKEMSVSDKCEVKEKNVKRKREKKEKSKENFEMVPNKKKKKEEEMDSGSGEVEVRGNNMFEKKEKEISSKRGKQDKGSKRQFWGKRDEQIKGKNKFRSKDSEEVCSSVEELIINGEKIKIVKFQGFYVTLEDAERLKKLRSDMKKEGIPKEKLESAIKLERRRAEKALSRLKKSVCFHCRGHGHLLSDCPELEEKESTGTGICYKCGSSEHSAGECKVVRGSKYQFAECFICKEQGHIARQCPDNPRGLYPRGGSCRECGDVTHLRKDCPRVLSQKEEEVVTVGVRDDRRLEGLDEEMEAKEKGDKKTVKKKKSTVKF